MIKRLFKFFIIHTFYLIIKAQDCFLSVPSDPLNKGLFKPWFVSTNPISQINCSQFVEGTEVFVEATIFDIDNNKFFVYYPLVIDINTEPAVQPEVGILPINNIVIIHVGINGDTVTLLPTVKNGIDSIVVGNCINGLPNGGSVFGQFAYCNGVNFFETVNKNINMGLLIIPPILNSALGDVCPTVRSFPVVDQDQSDNVLSQYIITQDLKISQDTLLNRNNLQILRIISNGSDNRLLNVFINPAIGCQSFTAPNLININIQQSSVALNEIQASLTPITDTTALVPPFSPFVVDVNNNNGQTVLKTNLYRNGVNQPNIMVLDDNLNINYCNQMGNLTPPFFIKHKNELMNMNSPTPDANNLLNFLAGRFQNSWDILQCQILIGKVSPINAIIDPITNIIISNNLLQLPQPPVLPPNNIKLPKLLCGNTINNANCAEACPNGLDTECITPGFQCHNVNNFIKCNVFNFCGNMFNNLKCDQPCPFGFDFECKILGDTCFKDVTNICKSNILP